MLPQSNESARPVASEGLPVAAPAQFNQSRIGFERRANIRRIIDALGIEPMMRDQVRALLAMSPSGARKYIKTLNVAGVMEINRYVGGTNYYLGEPEYVLSEDADLVARFLVELDTTPSRSYPGSKHKQHLDAAHHATGRHFHIMSDDEHYPVRVSKEPPAADPLALPAPFFAPPRQILRAKDRLPAAPPAPSMPTGFAALVSACQFRASAQHIFSDDELAALMGFPAAYTSMHCQGPAAPTGVCA